MHKAANFSKDFYLVAAGQVISIFGNQILRYALPLYLLNQTGSSALFGTIMAVSFLPMLLLYPIGGIIADRVNKRNIMVLLDFGTAALVLLFCLLAGRVAVVPLMAATMILLYGVQGTYQPAVQASVPLLVGAERIMQGNSIINLIHSVASLAGPVLGGILYSLVGLAPILYTSMACFFASAVMELFIRIPFTRRRTEGGVLATGYRDLRASFCFLFREQPVLWKAACLFAAVNLFLTSLLLIALPVLITQRLGFAESTANRLYGFAQGVLAAGAILGGLLAGAFASRLKAGAGPLLLAGCALSVLPAGVALQWPDAGALPIYCLLLVGGGLLVALTTVLQIRVMSCIQLLTPPDMLGKVISCVLCLCMCTSPLGQLLYGLVFEQIGGKVYRPFYLAAGAILAVSILARPVFACLGQVAGQRENHRG